MNKTFKELKAVLSMVGFGKICLLFFSLVIVSALPYNALALIQDNDREDHHSRTLIELHESDSKQFFTHEQALLSALSNASTGEDRKKKIDALTNIVVFYLENTYYEEALFLIENHGFKELSREEDADGISDLALLRFLSQFHIGRYKDIIEQKTENNQFPLVMALKAIGHEKLGQYQLAKSMFNKISELPDGLESLPENVQISYYLSQLKTAVMLEDGDRVKEIRNALSRYHLTKSEQDSRFFYTKISLLSAAYHNEDLLTDEFYRQLEPLLSLPAPYSIFAKMERLKIDLSTHKIDIEEALDHLERLRLSWQGGAIERELLLLRAQWSRQIGDLEKSIEDYRDVFHNNPNTDYEKIAKQDLREVMSELFLEEREFPLLEATRIFYANVDLLEPGSEGDEQIRDITQRLTELELLDEAAELLEHQVFQRLRGHNRALVAIELAEIYLADKNPIDALRVMQSTRITGLDDDVRNRRREIEAQALWNTGRHDRALARLDIMGDQRMPLSTLSLKARIEADMGDFSKASETFYPVVMEIFQSSKALAREEEILILQAVSAFSQAGDTFKISKIAITMQDLYPEHTSTIIVVSFAEDGDPVKFYDGYQEWVLAFPLEDKDLVALQVEKV